jgi:4a-hydroxytetrahydrobiopterin dehydratase
MTASDPKILSPEDINDHIQALEGWSKPEGSDEIEKTFSFKNYHHTMAFVNAVAWIAHKQDHHPDMQVGYNSCNVVYSTHSAGGITELDIEAAKQIEGL